MNIYTVARDDTIYHAFPDVEMAASGDLVCVFAQCVDHLDRDYAQIMFTRSSDRGRTWTGKRPLSDVTMKDLFWNCPRIIRLHDNRMLAICDKVDKPDSYGGSIYLWFGDENGENWQEPMETGCVGFMPDKILQLDENHWLLTTQTLDQSTEKRDIRCYHSYDQGKSWSDPVIAIAPRELQLCEPSVVAASNGDLVMTLRENSGQGLDCFKLISHDKGLTWSDVYRMPIPGCHRPVCQRLSSGNYMISYRFLHGGMGRGYKAQNLFVALLDEASLLEPDRNKQSVRICPLDFDSHPVADVGYTGWIQYEDGEIYMVNYIMDDARKAQIRGYSFTEKIFFTSWNRSE